MNFFRRLFSLPEKEKESQLDTEENTAAQPVDDTTPVSAEPESNETEEVTVEENTADTRPVPLLEEYSAARTETAELSDADNDDTSTADTATLNVLDGATRPLSADSLDMFQPHDGHIEFGQASDQGMVRTNNQDAAITFFSTSSSVDERPDFGMFIVADGMGGHHDGEKASAMASRIVSAEIIREIYLPMLDNTNIHDADRPTIGEILDTAVKRANEQIMEVVSDGGTTVTALITIGDLAHIAHVGDSRAYLITEDDFELITRDHSVVQRLIELNQLNREEASEHPQRNVLYRAVGQSSELEVDTLTRRLPPDSHVLICSDGLWGAVTEEEIREILTTSANPQEACEKFIGLANTHGGQDNITSILLRTPGK